MIQINKHTNKYWYKGKWVDDIPDEFKETDGFHINERDDFHIKEKDDFHIKETDEILKYKVIPSYF